MFPPTLQVLLVYIPTKERYPVMIKTEYMVNFVFTDQFDELVCSTYCPACYERDGDAIGGHGERPLIPTEATVCENCGKTFQYGKTQPKERK